MENIVVGELLKHTALLRQEYNYERELYKKQAEYSGISQLVQRGICWYPIEVEHRYYNSLNRLIIEVQQLSDMDEDQEHQFESGRIVTFFISSENNRLNYLNILGKISYIQNGRILVELETFEAYQALRNRTNLGIQLHFDNNSYKHMFAALSETINAKNSKLATLRDILLGDEDSTTTSHTHVGFSWLNKSQEKAVNHVINSNEVSIIHGPPGTGKTTTLVEAIYETLRRENQVLVCAQSNTAVDWISEKLVDRGINVLRIGNPTKVNDKMLAFTYERKFAAHPLFGQLKRARMELRASYSKKQRSSQKGKIGQIKAHIENLEWRIESALFGEARVIASTLVGASNRELINRRFSTLFIDEAAQALEAACWIPITRCDRVVFAGDHHQLPPTVKCIEAQRQGLGNTLMQKIAQHHPESVSLLTTQYRMHEAIMKFSSDWFYNGQMIAAEEVRDRGILQLDTPIEWYDTQRIETEEKITHSGGKLNEPEAQFAIVLLKQYIEKIGIERVLEERIDFGVISPYRAQVSYIRKLIKRDRFFIPIRNLITIHTVDGFQGQERDVILVSLVRSNETNEIGFLSDLRRMNVAITRAKLKLMLVGNQATLGKADFYRSLYNYITTVKGVKQLTLVNSSIKVYE